MSPELRLLLLCCRLETDGPTTAHIKALIDAEFDWNTLIELAVRHEVAPLLYRTLDRIAPDLVPPAVAHGLLVNYRGWQEHTANLWREMGRIFDGLAEHRIEAIPFKGPVLGLTLYKNLALRPFRDLDFLIHPSDIDRVLYCLQEMDFVWSSSFSPKQERYFRRLAGQYRIPRQDAKVWIEPHWMLSQRNFAIDLDHSALWERARITELEGRQVRRFAALDELLVLCTHGYREQWQRLKWICDIAEILRADQAIDWDTMLAEARRVGCSRILSLGLVLAKELLDAPVPASALGQRCVRVEELAAFVQKSLCEDVERGPRVWQANSFHFHGRERTRDKIRYVLRTTFSPRPSMFEKLRLPDSLFWAYYPARWASDYLLPPFWSQSKRITRN